MNEIPLVAVLRYQVGGVGYEQHEPPTTSDAQSAAVRIANQYGVPVAWTMAYVSGVYNFVNVDHRRIPLWNVTWPRGWRGRSTFVGSRSSHRTAGSDVEGGIATPGRL